MKKSDSKQLFLATVSILGQAPRAVELLSLPLREAIILYSNQIGLMITTQFIYTSALSEAINYV